MQAELHQRATTGNERGETDTSRARIGCGLGVRDHEKRKEQQAPALEMEPGDGEWVAKPHGAAHDQQAVRGEKRVGHIGALGSVHHQPAQPRQQAGRDRQTAPLAGRDPDFAGRRQHDDQTEVRGVEQMPAVDATHELARDGDEGGDQHELGPIGAEQETEREPRDPGAQRVEPW